MVKRYLEIERRWLLSGLPEAGILGATGVKWAKITTVYIVNDPNLEVRIRQQASNREITYSVTTKIGSGLTRQESPSLSADEALFDYYFLTRNKPYLVKDRWTILLETGQKLEINYFTLPKFTRGCGLLLAEIEFESENAANGFSDGNFPEWLKPLIAKEVTTDPRYNGKNLALHGRPSPK